MNTYQSQKRNTSIGRAAIAIAAIALTITACGTETTPQETGTVVQQPQVVSGPTRVSADAAERRGADALKRHYCLDVTSPKGGCPATADTSNARPGSKKFPELVP